MKTLITDDFDEGERWVSAEDQALIPTTIGNAVEMALVRREKDARSKLKAEPPDMTMLFVADAPASHARVWIRNDLKRHVNPASIFALRRWQCEGSTVWTDWAGVLACTEGYGLIRLADGEEY